MSTETISLTLQLLALSARDKAYDLKKNRDPFRPPDTARYNLLEDLADALDQTSFYLLNEAEREKALEASTHKPGKIDNTK